MASELAAVLNRIETLWEALTPTSRPTVLFRRLDGQRRVSDAIRTEATRGFELVEVARRVIADHPGGSLVAYEVQARVGYEQHPMGIPQTLETIRQQDAHQLISSIRNEAAWTAATVLVEYADEASWDDQDPNVAILRLRFRLHVIEAQP